MDPRREYDDINVPPHILTSGMIPVDIVEKLDGLSYVSNLYLGTTNQPVEIVYDTGSGYLTVSHDTCKSCLRPAYNDLMSNESKPLDDKRIFPLTVVSNHFLYVIVRQCKPRRFPDLGPGLHTSVRTAEVRERLKLLCDYPLEGSRHRGWDTWSVSRQQRRG